MSSENYVGIIMAENLRFLGEGSSAQGKPASWTRALVDPGERDRKQVGKPVNDEARKALMYAKVPVPQTDTGR